MAKKEVIGIFGGSFDPPHLGHLEVGRFVAAKRCMDQVLFMVANNPLQKTAQGNVTNVSDRYQMVELLLVDDVALQPSDLEIQLGGDSSTVRTLERLSAINPACDLELVIGHDVAVDIETWIDYERLPELAEIVVVDRPGAVRELPEFLNGAIRLSGPFIDVSSEMIKDRIVSGKDIDDLVPPKLAEYIYANSVYASNP